MQSRIFYASLLLVGATAMSCNNGGFSGKGGKKQIETKPVEEKKPEQKPQQPTETLGNSQAGEQVESKPPVQQPEIVVANNSSSDAVIAPPATPQQPQNVPPANPPPVTPPPANPPPANNPPVQSGDAPVGNLKFVASLFGNMESGLHATDLDVYAILKDGSGKVIAAGQMTPAASCRGEAVGDGMGYPSMRLNVPLQFAPGLQTGGQAGGSGSLSVCPVADAGVAMDALTCTQRQSSTGFDESGGSRPAFWYDRQVSYTVSGNTISIGGGGGGMGLQDGIGNGLSFAHPYAMGACGGKAQHFADYNSPLVLDLNGDDKLDLTDVWTGGGVRFALRGDDQLIHTGWVGAKDGLLVLDLDESGKIESGRELFGEHTATKGKQHNPWHNFDNGFQALAQYDANQDGALDDKDPMFAKLAVWRDLNVDGVTQKGELVSLKDLQITKISLAYVKTGSPGHFDMVAHNEVRLSSSFTTKDGKTHPVADVWFAQKKDVAALAQPITK